MNASAIGWVGHRLIEELSIVRVHIFQMWRILAGLTSSTLLCVLLLLTVRDAPREVTHLVIIYGETLLPIALGSLTASVLMTDPCRELWLTMPYPIWRLSLRRLTVLLIVTLLLWVLLVGVSAILSTAPLHIAPMRMAVGGSVTIIWFSALGFWGAIGLRSAGGGGALCATVWTGALLLRQALMATWLGQILHPFLTLQDSGNPHWVENRALLLTTAFILFALAMRRTRSEEPLLPCEGTQDDV